MKVLIYFEKEQLAPTGGPAGYLYNINKELEKNNISEVEFLNTKSNNRRKKILRILNKIPKPINQIIINYKKKYWARVINNIFYGKKYCTSMDLNKYDIIHFHSTLAMYNIKDSLKEYKGKIVLTSHSPKAYHLEILDNTPQEIKSKYIDEIKNIDIIDEYAFNRADYIHFPVPEAEECYYNTWSKYENIHKKNKDKYIYIPTGINSVTINTSKEEYRKKYNIPKDAFVISYVGRHNEIKGYAQLKEIGKKVLKIDSNLYFLIGGKEEPLKGIKDKNWIEVGWTNKPHDLINASDLFILPNKETYFDLIMLEVLSSGKTILATNTGGNKYFKKLKSKGIYYYDYGDIDTAIKLIKNIKKTNLKELEKNNKKIFNENFTIDIFVKSYLDMMKKIAKKDSEKNEI